MESEKVKELKKALAYAIQVGLDKFSLGASLSDCLTLISELESENERLNKALVDNKLKTENRQFKDRIAELEKEDETLKEFINGKV